MNNLHDFSQFAIKSDQDDRRQLKRGMDDKPERLAGFLPPTSKKHGELNTPAKGTAPAR
ncbi:hypothetical protein [Kiloniella spongiae]|uniref:hypothetical protein n=1 Tax=Kiloniella spongiae TaxID=1489064 RepID=UPI00138E3D45|nr:hypothetical protein [Kiloniella spongiae]